MDNQNPTKESGGWKKKLVVKNRNGFYGNNNMHLYFCIWRNSPQWATALLIHQVSSAHKTTHQSVGLLLTSDQLVAETST